MKVAVRLDDITPDMDWKRFRAFKALLDKYGIKPLIGVIPDNRDPMIGVSKDGKAQEEEFWSYIKKLQADGWSVAMHGYRHIYTTARGGMFPLNNFSEFAGVPYGQQEEMLRMGKKLLAEKGIETELFMAPAHSYDSNTLKALKNTGFTALTDGFGNQPYTMKGMTFYPISFMLNRTFQKKRGFSTMVVHTGTVSEEDLTKYENYFRQEGVTWIPFAEYLECPSVKRTLPGRIREYLMAKGKYLIAKSRSEEP